VGPDTLEVGGLTVCRLHDTPPVSDPAWGSPPSEGPPNQAVRM
jgi:hypothetical protein